MKKINIKKNKSQMKENEDKEGCSIGVSGGLGCLLTSIGIAIIIWALTGFPIIF